MKFDSSHYVPCLRWKEGEYRATGLLPHDLRRFITPLIEVPEVGYDFEKKSDLKTIDEHLEPFAMRLHKHWGRSPCFVDLKQIAPDARLKDGMHPVTFLFKELRKVTSHVVPVTGISRDDEYKKAITGIAAQDKYGICIRLLLEETVNPNLVGEIESLLAGQAASICDLVLDLGSPNFIPISGFVRLLHHTITNIPFLNEWRTFTVIGSSFPASMGEVNSGLERVPRNEWLLYKAVIPILKEHGIRLPTFGDYTINHPEVVRIDMRLTKPAGTLRYTVDDAWLISKGPNVRDNGFRQYVEHCKKIANSPDFLGPSFCPSDDYIAKCAEGKISTGTLTVWRRVGTNHHLVRLIRDISSFLGA